nr:MAG TPA: hypothetical protein [Bacteriophage sp.]
MYFHYITSFLNFWILLYYNPVYLNCQVFLV